MPLSPKLRKRLEAAVARHRAGDLDAAAAGYREVLATAPRNADALHLLGLVRHTQGDPTAALTLVEQARAENPRSAEIVYNLGRICLALRDWPMAEEANRAALALKPEMGVAWCNLGIACVRLGRAAEGEAAVRKALATGADNAVSWGALGLALHHQGREAEAEAACEQAVARDPHFAEARFNLATAYLRRRDFARGWPLFGARAESDPASFASGGAWPAHLPRWRGEPLDEKAVLLWGEQGLGDQILFASLLSELHARKIVFACAPRLVAVFRRAFPHITVIAQDGSVPETLDQLSLDVVVPLGDLGGLLRPSADAFVPRPFLRADAERVERLRARYRAWGRGGPFVGISWHSSRASLGPLKTLTLSQWAPILRGNPATFINLQYGETEADLAAAGVHGLAVHTDPEIDATHDLDGLAAQIVAMDLVISVSNTTAHLAGGLGVPTWTLAPVGGGSLWYWFEPQPPWQPSPWYAGMRVYHQDAPGAWDGMPQRVKVDLAEFCAAAP